MFKNPESIIRKLIFSNMKDGGDAIYLYYGTFGLRFPYSAEAKIKDVIDYFFEKIAEIEGENES